MNTTELIKKVRKIEIKTRGLSRLLFSGEYHSAFKGRGMSFSEVRAYSYGDDVRNIDWNVTARTGETHLKVFEEERELTVMLLVDMSASSSFGTGAVFKNELITEMAAVIAFSAISNNDKVGAILFSDRIEKYIPPKKGKESILRIIRELLYLRPVSKKTDISQALIYLNNIQKKRSISFIFSDFRASEFDQALKISAKKHDIIGVRIFDKAEKELPGAGLMFIQDAETGQTGLLDTSDKHIRENYSQRYLAHENYVTHAFAKAQSDLISFQSDDNYIQAMHIFFKKRSSR
jgi:uncharacterized protein (DUF58 family)